jgi:quinoprotein glucose dehydrogenase
MIRTVALALAGLLTSVSLVRAEAGWPHYGGDAGGTRHSVAAEITPGNVGELRRAWLYRTGDMKARADDMKFSAFEGTPILVAGALIFCTPFNEVIALDPGTGAEKWRYDPKVATGYRPANQFVCRGVTQWADAAAGEGDLCASRLFMGTVDGRLIALDAPTGQPCLGFGMDGEVKIDPGMALLTRSEFQITSPPVVARGVVVIGSAIGDNQRADAPRGTVRAYDARSGRPVWDFNPVARGAEDFSGDWQDGSAGRTGHANAWAPMSVDEARGMIFVPTSSPSPDFFGGERVGDNRYANSVVALDAASGEVRWHFQTVHHDVWDYDLPAQPSLVTLRRDGKPLDAVVQVTKTGLVFVLDRDTGKPVFEVEERPVPQGGVLGEVLSPTQPFPVAPPHLLGSQYLPRNDRRGAFGGALHAAVRAGDDPLSVHGRRRQLGRHGFRPRQPGHVHKHEQDGACRHADPAQRICGGEGGRAQQGDFSAIGDGVGHETRHPAVAHRPALQQATFRHDPCDRSQ